ncbi:MAG: thioredoxin domain-containing protein, partial [Anaerolineales bacterium]|nr:thioredoxin domain-containing protein [Anaerolineales bacterium]
TTPIIAVVMLVIGLLVGYFGRPFTRSGSQPVAAQPGVITASAPPVVIPTADNSAAQQNLMETVVAQTRHFRGDPNALVTIIEFGDFQCPFCGRHAAIVGPQIDEKYIQSGKVRFGYWNFAFLGDESTWAAEAAECAADQDKFWEYHDIIYSSQSGENQGAFNKDNLKKFAQELGLDTQAFNECLDSGKYTSLIQADTQASSAMGFQSTPTFLVNGQPVIGAQPFEVFQQTIDALLK